MKLDITKRDRERFEYIETQLFWGGGITARELAETFGISRQAAQEVINNYRRRYPKQMKYDPSRKRHEASETFEAAFIRTDATRFLDYLRSQVLMGYYREREDWSNIEMTDVDRLLRPTLPLGPIKLPQLMQEALLRNYETEQPGVRVIVCRKALAFYIKRKLLADDSKYKIPLWSLTGEQMMGSYKQV